jgi:primosomal protein N'
MKCHYCSYEWKERIKNPKSCPRCKHRFDYKMAQEVLKKLGKKFGYDLAFINSGADE